MALRRVFIRAAIFGVILFLAIIGMVSVVNNWFSDSSDADEKLAAIAADSDAIEGISPYKKLEKSWVDTRAL